MRYLTQTIRSLGVTFRNLFRAPTTEYFGRPEHDKGERFRSSFALLYEDQVRNEAGELEAGRGDELCIACKKCEMICPSFIITVVPGEKRESALTGKKRGYLEDFTLDMNACIFCELCVQVCPVDAIVMCRESTVPAFHREDLVLTMDKLYRNGDDKPLSWGTGTKLVDMQDPSRLSPEQEAAKQAKVAEMEARQAEEPDAASEEAIS
jgi:formate hydrogenlyase subunit 6/NADH:ubiquinone oxidoreductase subunit I